MPERPATVTAPELAEAIREMREEVSRALGTGMAELAGALKPGANVRDLGSDKVSIFTLMVPGGMTVSQQLIGNDITRTKLTLCAFGSGEPGTQSAVRLYDRPGVLVTAADQSEGIPLLTGVPLDIATRAPLYVTTGPPWPEVVPVYVIAHQADFYA